MAFMILVNTKRMLQKARQGGYAVGGFNAYDFLSIRSVVEAAVELNSPAILQILPPVVNQFGTATIAAWAAQLAARHVGLPLVLHLDHGTDLAMIESAIRAGFNSVMFDGSQLPFEENICLTKQVVNMAHRRNVTVEGEVGCVLAADASRADRESLDRLATVEGCYRYIRETGADSIAPAIGTAHGLYRDIPNLNYERLAAIARSCDIPLVIHGGTGLTDEDFRSLIRCGASKINIATQLRLEYLAAMEAFPRAHPGSDEPLQLFADVAARIKFKVKEFIGIFGSAGKA